VDVSPRAQRHDDATLVWVCGNDTASGKCAVCVGVGQYPSALRGAREGSGVPGLGEKRWVAQGLEKIFIADKARRHLHRGFTGQFPGVWAEGFEVGWVRAFHGFLAGYRRAKI
jgi:hypothetical protein